MAFELDTSGCVRLLRKDAPWKGLPKPDIYWSDLSPFAQGYVWAAFESWAASFPAPQERGEQRVKLRPLGFSDLAPATLAEMLADCEQHGRIYGDDTTREEGQAFWQNRQDAVISWQGWKPLTLHLGDDGLIYSRGAT